MSTSMARKLRWRTAHTTCRWIATVTCALLTSARPTLTSWWVSLWVCVLLASHSPYSLSQRNLRMEIIPLRAKTITTWAQTKITARRWCMAINPAKRSTGLWRVSLTTRAMVTITMEQTKCCTLIQSDFVFTNRLKSSVLNSIDILSNQIDTQNFAKVCLKASSSSRFVIVEPQQSLRLRPLLLKKRKKKKKQKWQQWVCFPRIDQPRRRWATCTRDSYACHRVHILCANLPVIKERKQY